MRHICKYISVFCILLLYMVTFSACEADQVVVSSFNENYEYTQKNAFYPRPSFVNAGSRLDTLSVILEDGIYTCFTTDSSAADAFINSQRTLLRFLKDSGVEVRTLKYFGIHFDDNFSDCSKNSAYIALSSIGTYQQVLVTLQTLWGDYTDFGYVYAVSNAIAERLGWQTDVIDSVDKNLLSSFFLANPSAVNLLYPCFTSRFASEETVNCCKVLSRDLFDNFDLLTVLRKPIEEQLDDFYEVLNGYVKKNSIPFIRQNCGYAYYGEYLPLRISTTYAQLIVDRNYSDYSLIYDDYFSDYLSIYQTSNIIDREIVDAVANFGLEERAGKISINWLSGDSAEAKFGKRLVNGYNSNLQEVTVTTMTGYLHEYYHHIEHLINPNLGQCWQSQAFCEIGRSHSQYAQYVMERNFTQNEDWAELFYQCTGRNYQAGVGDYFEAYDILCYITNEYELDYLNGRNGINSFSHYLIDCYGEETVYDMMLFPDTVEDITGKTWEELEDEWNLYMQDKYAGINFNLSALE